MTTSTKMICRNCGVDEYWDDGGGGGMSSIAASIGGRPLCGPCFHDLYPLVRQDGRSFGSTEALLRGLSKRKRQKATILIQERADKLEDWLAKYS